MCRSSNGSPEGESTRSWRLLALLAVVFGSLLLAAPALGSHTFVRAS